MATRVPATHGTEGAGHAVKKATPASSRRPLPPPRGWAPPFPEEGELRIIPQKQKKETEFLIERCNEDRRGRRLSSGGSLPDDGPRSRPLQGHAGAVVVRRQNGES